MFSQFKLLTKSLKSGIWSIKGGLGEVHGVQTLSFST